MAEWFWKVLEELCSMLYCSSPNMDCHGSGRVAVATGKVEPSKGPLSPDVLAQFLPGDPHVSLPWVFSQWLAQPPDHGAAPPVTETPASNPSTHVPSTTTVSVWSMA
ncbi:unnamed protein product [Lota lota]